MKISKETRSKLVKSLGDLLIEIENNELNSEELDKILSRLSDAITLLPDLDNKVIKDLVAFQATQKNISIKNKLEKLLSYSRKKNYKILSIEDKTIQERLYRHFKTNLTESKNKTPDTSFEVKTKHLIPDQKLYFEQNKVLLTILTSHICTQNQIDRIKNLIEDDKTFTHCIKKVVKDKTQLNRVKELCRLQDERFTLDEETSKRLYL